MNLCIIHSEYFCTGNWNLTLAEAWQKTCLELFILVLSFYQITIIAVLQLLGNKKTNVLLKRKQGKSFNISFYKSHERRKIDLAGMIHHLFFLNREWNFTRASKQSLNIIVIHSRVNDVKRKRKRTSIIVHTFS